MPRPSGPHSRAPTLLIGNAPRVVVPVARCLAAHGVPVRGASVRPGEPPVRSRYVQGFDELTPPEQSAQQFSDELLALARKYQVDTVIPVGDVELRGLAAVSPGLSEHLKLGCPASASLRQALDREVLAHAGIEGRREVIPRTDLATPTQLDDLPESLAFPVLAYPLDSRRARGRHVRVFHQRDALETFLITYLQRGIGMRIQGFPGNETVSLEVLMHAGHPVAAFQYSWLNTLPVAAGTPTRVVSEALDEPLLEDAAALLQGLDWEGVATVDLRRDRETGRCRWMDLRPGYQGSTAFAVQCGAALPRLHRDVLHGGAGSAAGGYAAGRRARWAVGELQRLPEAGARWLGRERTLKRCAQDVGTWVLDGFNGTRDPLWQPADLRPGIDEWTTASGEALRSGARELSRRLLPWQLARRAHEGIDLGLTGSLRVAWLRAFPQRLRTTHRDLSGVKNLVVVCQGNVIRSALAGCMLAHPDRPGIEVISAGIRARDGKPADPVAMRVALEFGLSLDAHAARQLTRPMVERADRIVIMDWSNRVRVLARYPEARAKLVMMGAFHPGLQTGQKIPEMQDPFARGEDALRDCYRRLVPAVEHLGQCLARGARSPEQGPEPAAEGRRP